MLYRNWSTDQWLPQTPGDGLMLLKVFMYVFRSDSMYYIIYLDSSDGFVDIIRVSCIQKKKNFFGGCKLQLHVEETLIVVANHDAIPTTEHPHWNSLQTFPYI